jgi:hypothetical protein
MLVKEKEIDRKKRFPKQYFSYSTLISMLEG